MKELTTGKVYKRILFFSLPMFAGQFLQQLYNVVDSIIVGKFLGKQALAAVGNSFPVIFALISFIIGIVSGTTIIIAQYYGAKDMEKVEKAIDTMYVFAFFVSIIIPIISILFIEDIFRFINLPEEIIPAAKLYFSIFISGMLLMFGFNATNAVLRGLGDSLTPLLFIGISTFLNIVLDILFVVVFKFGIAGVASATVLAQGLGFGFSMFYLNKYHKVFNFSLKNIRYSWQMLRQSLRIGIPAGFHQISVALSLMAILFIVNKFGTNVIAAYTAGGRISSLAAIPPMVFGTALATFSGQNFGAGKPERVKKGLLFTALFSGGIALFYSIIIFLFNKPIIRLFINDPEIVKIGSQYLLIVCWFYIIFAMMFIFNGVIQGAGDTLIPMVITILALWLIRIPGAYIFSQKYGEIAIWWAFPISWTISMILSFIYYLTGKWKKKIIVKSET